MNVPRTLAAALAVSAGACSLIVPGPDDFTYDLESDAGPPDGGVELDAGPLDAGCPSVMCGAECTDTRTDPAHCGSCARSCSAPANGMPTCADAVCGFECDPGYARVVGTCVEREAPRPIAPLSTATVSSRRPTLRWELAPRSDGARIELCEDRACTSVLSTIDAAGTSARSTSDLPSGVVFWRLFALAAGIPGPSPSVTWQFHVGARSADGGVDTSWGTNLDVNGDGFGDVVIGANNENSSEGAAYVYHGSPSGPSATPEPALRGAGGAGGSFGYSVASAGDVNGDGFGDVVIGAHSERSGDGAAYVYHGGPSGLSATPAPALRGPAGAGGAFGLSVASAGDVNGDGFADVVIGARGENSGDGAAYVYHGGASGLSATPEPAFRGVAVARGLFGFSVASAGDVNGDGFGDVVIGAHGERSGEGAAYVYHGGPSGLNPTPEPALRGPAGARGGLGYSVASAGDVNGDGLGDIVIGAHGENAAYVYHGGSSGLSATPEPALRGAGGEFGYSVASAGDVNGDGFADVVIGAHGESSTDGAAYVYHGAPSGVSATPESALRGPARAFGYFGHSVASTGDVNGDGFGDVVIGAPAERSSDGAAYVYHGGASGLRATPEPALRGSAGVVGYFGNSVASAGDVNGDDFGDLVIGACNENSSEGAAYVHQGGRAA